MTAQAFTSNIPTAPTPLGSSTRSTRRESRQKNSKPSKRVASISAQTLVAIDEQLRLEEPIIVFSRSKQELVDALVKLMKDRVIRPSKHVDEPTRKRIAHAIACKVTNNILDKKLVVLDEIDMTSLPPKKRRAEFAVLVSREGQMFLRGHGRDNNSSVRGVRRRVRKEVAA